MFTHLKGLKIEIEHLQLLMEKAKLKLQKDFEAWWSEETVNLQVFRCLYFHFQNNFYICQMKTTLGCFSLIKYLNADFASLT